MKTIHCIFLVFLLAASAFAAEFEPYNLTIDGKIYRIKATDVNGYVIQTPDGRTIGLPAADPAVKLTVATLTAALATPPVPPAPVHRILKDTLIQRVKAANKLADLRAMINALDADARFEWDNSSWFSSDNAMIVQGVTALGLTPATLLAADPLAP
ncbi:MAG TPA: hypothetical protein VK985_09600 [Rariglobus sp.]|nr:hypothetical protein [Rariglobus sp.]